MSLKPFNYIEVARQVIEDEGRAVLHLTKILDERFNQLCEWVQQCKGRVIFIGVGKSYIVAQKAACSLSSLGTPAFYVHAADAAHGDLGMITRDDLAILISHSGETREITYLLEHIKKIGPKTVALVGNPDSTLGRGVDLAVPTGVEEEAGPIKHAPTASALATQALCDGLVVAVACAKGFSEKDFYQLHPGGHIGDTLSNKFK